MLLSTKRTLLSPDDLYSRRIQEFSSNLVAHWPLNELSGTTAYDKSIGGFDGTITTATLGQTGIGDGLTSMSFDGTNDYIDISAIASNLVANGGFETAGAGDPDFFASWTESGVGAGDVIADEGVNIHTGSHAVKLTNGNDGCYLVGDVYATYSVGQSYVLVFWTRGDGSVAGQYRIYDQTNGAYIVAKTSTAITGASYTKVSVPFTIATASARLRVYLDSPSAAGDAYFDTVSLRRTDIPTFDPHEGSVIVWAKVSAAGVWTDRAGRRLISLEHDAKNKLYVRKQSGNDTIIFVYEGNDTQDYYQKSSYSPAGWASYGFTWSLSGDALEYYLDGASAASDSALGVFTGQLVSTTVCIGSSNTTPGEQWDGNLAHAQIYNTPLSADEMKYLMTLP